MKIDEKWQYLYILIFFIKRTKFTIIQNNAIGNRDKILKKESAKESTANVYSSTNNIFFKKCPLPCL